MTQELKVVARENITKTSCTLDEDGYWKSISTFTDRVLYEGQEEWIEESIDAMGVDKNVRDAIQTSVASVLNYLIQNAYRAGFNGLVEWKQFQKALENAKSAESQAS